MRAPHRMAFAVATAIAVAYACATARAATTWTFEKGWRLVSLPVAMEGRNLCDYLPGLSVSKINGGGYANCIDGASATVETGKGYWVYFPEKTQVIFPSAIRTGGTYKAALKRGWNIIGSPVGVTMPWNGEILVNGVAVTMSPKTGRVIYRYDPNQKKYAPAESMEPWTGYAIYAVEDCELQFPVSQGEGITQGGTEEVETLPGGERVVARQLIVAKATGTTEAFFEVEVARYGIAILGKNSSAGLYQIQLPVDVDIETAAETLKKMGVAEAAAPHYVFGISEHIPFDPPYAPGVDPAQSWAFKKIRAPGVWTAYHSGSAPTLAFVDTGVDSAHMDFTGKLVPGADFIGDGNGTQDGHGHGTHAAGLAAAAGDNGYGVAGVCWGCRVMPVKVCDSKGDCPFFAVMNGITFAANAGADVINLSVQGKVEQGSDAWKIFQTVIDHAVGTGATVVAAAGNSASDAFSFVPAGLEGVITVGATDEGDALTAFSNFGAALDIAAPGVRVYSLEPGGWMEYRDGTSSAAALVSGAAGLIIGARPTASNDEVAAFLRETADPAAGAYPPLGRLNLERLMAAASPPNAAPQIHAIYAIPDSVSPGATIDVSAQVYDSDGDALTYKWESNFGAAAPGSGATAKWTAPATRGAYAVRLTVSDGRGGNASAKAYVGVGLDGLFMIRMGGIPAFMRVGETFEFKAYGQFADGEIYPMNIEWELASPHGVISADGKFTALLEGEAMLTARAGEMRRDAVVTILAPGETPPPLTVSGFAAPAGGDVVLTGDYGYDRLVVGDITGDGVNDLIVGGVDGLLPFKAYRGAGDGSFFLISTFGPNGCNTNHMALADIDGDGDLDLGAACLSGGGFKIYKNNGAGSFSISQQLCSPGCNGTSIVFADMSRNMRMDVFGSDTITTNRNRIFYYDEAQHALGNPGMFQTSGVEAGSQANTQKVDVAYFNRTSGGSEDHYLDFAEANYNTQTRIYLYNTATGAYDMSSQFGAASSNTLIVAEVTGGGAPCDGDWDVIVAENSAIEGINIFRGNGSGGVSSNTPLATTPATEFYSLTLAETENNIMPEIVAGTLDNKKARLFTSTGDSEACALSYKLETMDLPEYSMDVSFGDFTGNRNPDLAIAGGNYITNEVWINDTAGSNTAPGAPASAGCSVIESAGAGVLRLNWEKGTDAEAGLNKNLLTYDLRLTEHNAAAPSAAQPDRWSGAAAFRMGNYLRSRSLGGGNTYQMDFSLGDDTALNVPYGSYYFNVRTVDAANARSAWFAPGLPVKCDNFVPEITSAAVFNPPFILNNGFSLTALSVTVKDYNGIADITAASVNLTNINGTAALALTHESGGAEAMKFAASAINSTSGLAPGTKTATVSVQDAAGAVPIGYPASVSLDVEQWPEMTVCGDDWPMFNCDERRRSVSGVDSLWFVPFEQKWSKSLAQTTTAAPVVKDSVVMIGLSDGTLAAYATSDGSPEWSAAAGAGPVAAAGAVASSGGVDALYTVSGSKVYAHRVSDGSAFWAAPNESATASITLPPIAMLSPVAATYDLLFFVDVNGIVHAVNKSDGALRWKVKGTGSAAVAAPIAVGNGVLFVGDTAGNIFAFDTMTGTQAASATLPGGPEIKSIIVASNRLIILTPQTIYALSMSGAPVWNRPNPNGENFTGSAAWVESESTLYAADDGGWVYKINAAGTIAESGQLPGGPAVDAPLVYVSGVVYAGAQDGKIYGINTDGMGVTSSVSACPGSGVTGGLAVADETLFAVCGGAASKTLFAYKKADGLGPQADTCPQVSDSTDGAGLGTLRDCITKANATPVTHGNITFAGALSGATIAIGPNPLPAITADGVSIDGAALSITIDGSGCTATNCHGFKITEANATIKNLTIVNFSKDTCDDLQGASAPFVTGCAAIAVDGNASGQVTITGNTIGIKTNGDMAGNYHGIHVGGCPGGVCAAMNVDIGGNAAQYRNVISGSLGKGIALNENAEGVSIKGNYIGTARDGRSCSSGGNSTSNLGGGIYMIRAMDNSIGVEPGGAAGESNVISCNGNQATPSANTGGIYVDRSVSVGTHIAGNCIGLCLSAANRCEQDCGGNHGPGIVFSDVYASAGNKAELGYDGDDKYTNVISGNKLQGIYMYNAQHVNIRNARIGLPQKNTAVEDYTDRGNTNDGIMMTGSSRYNTIVNNAAYPVRIAYNDASGILIEDVGASNNKFTGVLIYENDNPDNEPVELSNGANQNVLRPVIGSILTSGANFNITVNPVIVCTGCEVALYQATDSLLGIAEDGTGYGEGPYLLGTATTDGTGAATFTNVAVAQGEFVTAIFTDGNSNSSMFALNKEVQPEDCVKVTSTADSGLGTLRHCINYANSNPGFAIMFDAALSGQTITPLTQLPTVTANGTSIDGDINSDGTPDITISGASCGVCDGLVWKAGNGTIKGLKVIRFSGATKAGIRLETAAAMNNTITGNYIGNTGAAAFANRYGVYILTNANGNIIGPNNVISGNTEHGIYIYATNSHTIKGNAIGSNAAMTSGIPNNRGVYIFSGSSNTIGGSGANEANLIAYNTNNGINTQLGTEADYNKYSRNRVFSNGGPETAGILNADGVNKNIKPPIINSIVANGANYDIGMTIQSPITSGCTLALPCVVEVFSVDNPPGVWPDTTAGEAYMFAAAQNVTTCAAFPCNISFSIPQASVWGAATRLTATVTSANNNTSMFANNRTLNQPPSVTDCAFDPISGAPGFTPVRLSCTVTDPNGHGDIDSVTAPDADGVFGGADLILVRDGLTDTYKIEGLTVAGALPDPYSFTVTAEDDTGATDDGAATFTVTNAAPTVSGCAFTPPSGAPGFTPVRLSCTVTDPNGHDDIVSVKAPDADGVFGGAELVLVRDGLTDTYKTGDLTVAGALPDPYSFTVAAEDDTGATDDGAATFTVENVAPTVSGCAFTPPSGAPGFTPVKLSCTVTDPNGHADIKSVTAPDTDGVFGGAELVLVRDGSTDIYEIEGLTVAGALPDPYSFTVTAEDDTGATDDGAATFTVTNVAPSVSDCAFDPASGIPGFTPVKLSCTVTDPNGHDDIVSVKAPDADGVFGGADLVLARDGLTDTYKIEGLTVAGALPDPYSFTVTAEDDTGATDDGAATFTVTNVAPSVSDCAFDPASGTPGFSPVRLSCTVTDPNGHGDIDSVTAPDADGVFGGADLVLVRDGLTDTYKTGDLTVAGALPDPYSFTVTAEDDTGATDDGSATFTVTNADPSVTDCGFVPASGAPGASVVLSCTVTDPNGHGDIVSVKAPDTDGVFGGAELVLVRDGLTDTYKTGDLTVAGALPDPYSFTVTAEDDTGATDDGSATFTVTGSPPSVTDCAFDPISGVPGLTPVRLSCTVTDPNGHDDIDSVTAPDTDSVFGGADLVLVRDGLTDTYKTGDLMVAGALPDPYSFTVTAEDDTGATDDGAATFTVTNVAPSVSDCAFDPAIGAPGFTPVRLSCTVTDPNGHDDIVSVKTPDTDGVFGGAELVLVRDGLTDTYKTGDLTVAGALPDPYSFTVTAEDDTGATDDGAATFTVTNVAPSVSDCAFDPASGAPGFTPVKLSCTVTDPNGHGDIDSVTAPDADGVFGGADLVLVRDGLTDTYKTGDLMVAGALPDPYSFTVTAEDDTGATDDGAATFTVTNIAPAISACAFTPPSGAPGFTPVRLSCTVTDPNGHADIKSVAAPDPDGVFGAAPIALTRVGATDVYQSAALTVQAVAQLPYVFTATATDFSDAASSQSNMQFTVTGLVFPGAPVITNAQGANGEITVTLVAPTMNNDGLPLTNLVQHSLFVSPTPGGPYAAAGSVVSAVPGATYQFVHNGPFTWYDSYCYVARAIDSDGGESVYSNEMCAVAQPPAYSPGKTCAQLPGDVYIAPDTPGYVNRPTGVSIGAPSPSGFNYVYIADNHNNRVSVFDEDCNFYETWGEYGNEPGNFIIPNDVLYHDGFVYVSDAISRIQKFDAATGDYVAHGTVTGPWMMAMLPSGSMLVATHYKKLAVFDPVALVENTAAAMTVPDSNGVVYNPSNGLVYISDKENNVVMAYTTGGTPQPANNLGYGPGSGFGQLDTPAGLAVDSSGNIYVADSGNDRIQVFSPSNQLINTIGSKGAGPGQLRSPYGIAISSTTGLVWVADHLNQRFTGYAPPP